MPAVRKATIYLNSRVWQPLYIYLDGSDSHFMCIYIYRKSEKELSGSNLPSRASQTESLGEHCASMPCSKDTTLRLCSTDTTPSTPLHCYGFSACT